MPPSYKRYVPFIFNLFIYNQWIDSGYSGEVEVSGYELTGDNKISSAGQNCPQVGYYSPFVYRGEGETQVDNHCM